MKTKRNGIGCWIAAMGMVFGLTAGVHAQQVKPATTAPDPVKAPPLESEWNNPLPSGRLTLGMHFGDQQAENFGDILVPVMQFKSSLLFINPRGTWNDSDGQEFNFGLGYRYLIPSRSIIVGGNLFYDLRNTSLDNTFQQLGGGLEYLSTWLDARVNMYLPEDGKKTADEYMVSEGSVTEHGDYWYAPTGQGHLITQYGYDVTSTYDVKTLQHYQMVEQAMKGFDFEVGALLPIPAVRDYADVKVFGGYYDYTAHYGDDISGVKGRIEVKPVPSICLDAAWFEDKDLIGSHYSVGFRVSVPFDLANLSRGRNPFAGALDGFKPGAKKPDFASRMTEMVVRDLHIRTDASEPEEVVSDRRVLEKKIVNTDRKDYNILLASDVTFVDDDNRSGVEDGSWENPYRQINTGVQSAIGTMVYVRDAAQQYYENVLLRDGLTLWGSGAPIYGQGSRYLGGIFPVVNGMGQGPAITLANHVTVAGFEITQGGGAPVMDKGRGFGLAGIYGNNVTDVSIHHNFIHGSGSTTDGIQLIGVGMPSITADISDNRIDDVRGNGINVGLYDVPNVDLILANNNVTRCDQDGLRINADGNHGDTFLARISGNYSENLGNGISLQANGYNLAAGLFVDTTANYNGREGITAAFYRNHIAGALYASHADLDRVDQLVNSLAGSLSSILPIDLGDGFSVGDLLGLRGLYCAGGAMQAIGNGGNGIYLSQQSTDLNLAALIGVQTDGNGAGRNNKDGSGGGLEVYQSGSWDENYNTYENANVSVAAIIRSQANGNHGPGMRVSSSADDLALNLFVDVKANDNNNCGVRSSVYSQYGLAGSVVLASDPLLSLIETVAGSPLLSDYMNPMDLSSVPAFGQVQANRNWGSGIYINAQGHDGAFGLVLDAQANGNGIDPDHYRPGNGIQLELDSDNGPVLGLVGSTEALIGLAKSVLDSENIPVDLSKVRTLGPLQANDNRDNGVTIRAHGTDAAMVGVVGVDALRNGQGLTLETTSKNGLGGNGINLDVMSQEGDAMVGLASINASGNRGDGIYANVNANSSYGEAMLGGIDIKANDNQNNGLNLRVQSQGPDSSYLVLAGVDASRNIEGSGIGALVTGQGKVMAALTAIRANDNGSNGVALEADSYNGDSHVWISETAVQDMSDHGGGWDLLGFDIIPLLPSGPVEANGNGGNGISINSSSPDGDVLVDVRDTTASRNGLHGVLAELDAYGTVDATFEDIVANDNNNGVRVVVNGDLTPAFAPKESVINDVDLAVRNVSASGNNNNGINAIMTAPGRMGANFTGNTTGTNGNNGLRVEMTSSGDDLVMTVDGNKAAGNSESGIKTLLSASNIDARYNDNEAEGNTEDGLHIKASAGQQLKLFGEGNVAKNNGDDGIDVKTSAANGAANRQFDFGGGVLGSAGHNVMANNAGYDMERNGGGAFSAQYNYWDGIVPPVINSEFTGNNMNVNNALTTDPSMP